MALTRFLERLVSLCASVVNAGSLLLLYALLLIQLYKGPMFKDQVELAQSFFKQALHDYIEACEHTVFLYDNGRIPEREEEIRAGTRFKSAYAKLRTVIKVANYKFGTSFEMPHLVFDTKWCEKVQ
jgi:hypothetical protein